MKRILGTRGFISVAGACLLVIAAFAAYFVATNPLQKRLSYCAMMPDVIGLYSGNQVTIRGMAVGTVTSIRPDGNEIRVDFTVDAAHPLHGNATATTVSDTLVADRNLAVLGEAVQKPLWPTDQCITKTYTPKSISQTLSAFSKLSSDLTDGNADDTELQRSAEALDAATSGTGPKLNNLINQLGSVLHAPDAAIGHIGDLINATASLTDSISANWGDIKQALTQAQEGLTFINQVWQTTTQLINSLEVLFPWFNDITREYGRPILNGFDASGPALKLLAANVGTLEQMVNMVPPIMAAMQRTVDPTTGRVTVTYAQPSVTLPAAAGARICSTINSLAPGHCPSTPAGVNSVPLVPLVLQLTGAR